mgnify:CR=1 FL=1
MDLAEKEKKLKNTRNQLNILEKNMLIVWKKIKNSKNPYISEDIKNHYKNYYEELITIEHKKKVALEKILDDLEKSIEKIPQNTLQYNTVEKELIRVSNKLDSVGKKLKMII